MTTWVHVQTTGVYSADNNTYVDASFTARPAAGSLVLAFGTWMAPSGYSGFEELATPGDTFGDGATWQTLGKTTGNDGSGGILVSKLWCKVIGTSAGSGKLVAIQNQGSSSGNVGLIISNITNPLPLSGYKASTYSGSSGNSTTVDLTSFAADNNILCISAVRAITSGSIGAPASFTNRYLGNAKSDGLQQHAFATYAPATSVTANPDRTITSAPWVGNAAGFESWVKPPSGTTFFQYLLSQKAFG